MKRLRILYLLDGFEAPVFLSLGLNRQRGWLRRCRFRKKEPWELTTIRRAVELGLGATSAAAYRVIND